MDEDFEKLSYARPESLPGEFLQFLRHSGKWWLLPLILVLLLVGALILLGSTAAGPFIYTMF